MAAVAIDLGHAFVKVRSERGRLLLPALITPAPPQVDVGETVAMPTWRIDDQEYWVGETARGYSAARWSRDKDTDQASLRLCVIAAAMTGQHGPVALAVGLPLAWYGSQRQKLRQALTGFGGTVTPIHEQTPPRRLWFESVQVLPQGLAAAIWLLSQPRYEPGVYIIADVGYRTTDYVQAIKTAQGAIQVNPAEAGSLEWGTHAVAQQVAAQLEREWHVPFHPAELEQQAQVTVAGRVLALGPYWRSAGARVGQQWADQMQERLDVALVKATRVLLIGGGAELMQPYLPHSEIPADPQWANVEAYWAALAGAGR